MLEGLSSDILERPAVLTADDTNGDVLAHFGIKGQKWGIRRYQNSDGTLTDAGKKRYSSNGNYDSYRSGTGQIAKDFPNDPAKQASALKQIADSRKKDAYDRLDKASKSGDLKEDVSNLVKSGTVKSKSDALKYLVDAAKKYNEEIDDDGSMFQALGRELYLYQKGYLDKGTFDKLYDAEAARSVADYGQLVYTDPIYAESVKDMHDYKSKLNNRLSWWFGDDSSNPEYNPNKPISYTEGSALSEDYYTSHSDDTSDFLAHHGIKGQKWGNRRYQNSDGSLTPLGRVRYGVGAARKAAGKAIRKATGRQTDAELQDELNKAIHKHNRDMMKRDIDNLSGKRKKISKMTDSELDAYIDRMAREREARAMSKELRNDSRNFISKFAHEAAENAAKQAAAGIGEGIKRGISNSLATKFDEAEKRKQAKKWDEYDEKHNADKVDAAKTRDKLNATRDKLELRALNGDTDAAAILNTVAKSSRGNADKHSNTSATKDAVENARNMLELQAINGDKEALKRLKKITDAKKGSKNGGKGGSGGQGNSGGRDGSGNQGGSGRKKKSSNPTNNQNNRAQNNTQSASSTPDKKNKKNKQNSQGPKDKSIISSQEAYQAARQKAKDNLKKQSSTPVSRVRSNSADNYTKNWIINESSKKTPPIGRNY